MTNPLEQNETFQFMLEHVNHVASGMTQFQSSPITDDMAKNITQRICEERKEDALDFWLFVTDIEALADDDDWSDANGCIENIIEKHIDEKTAIESA